MEVLVQFTEDGRWQVERVTASVEDLAKLVGEIGLARKVEHEVSVQRQSFS